MNPEKNVTFMEINYHREIMDYGDVLHGIKPKFSNWEMCYKIILKDDTMIKGCQDYEKGPTRKPEYHST
jgi:hypothetical protein